MKDLTKLSCVPLYILYEVTEDVEKEISFSASLQSCVYTLLLLDFGHTSNCTVTIKIGVVLDSTKPETLTLIYDAMNYTPTEVIQISVPELIDNGDNSVILTPNCIHVQIIFTKNEGAQNMECDLVLTQLVYKPDGVNVLMNIASEIEHNFSGVLVS